MPMTLLSSLNLSRNVTWKEAMEKGLTVSAGKTKIMIYGTGLDFLQSFHALSFAVE